MTGPKKGVAAETIAAAFGVASDPPYAAVAPPLYLSSTYAFDGYERPNAYDYGRAGNPTRTLLADALAKLEGGAGAVVTASGMAAADLLFNQLQPTDLVVAPHDCYGGTYRLLRARADRGHLRVRFVDQNDRTALDDALADGASLVFIETPSNPLMRIIDIKMVADRAHRAGARVAVDNTFLSPALQCPIALGADYVLHSTTKYLNGHSDVIGGAVIAADLDQVEALRTWANIVGSSGSPFDSWLTLRGLRTLFARIERQQKTALRIAEHLTRDAKVRAVHYPGLSSHPHHALAIRQQRGAGAMLSFELAHADAVRHFVDAVEVFTLAESLGGVESLVAHPATMTHADMGEEARKVAGIGDGLVRLSVGLEHEDDLIEDLAKGLAAC